MKWGASVPPWVPVKSFICARFDCNLVRKLGRRYCGTHAEEYEREANAIPEDKKLVRTSGAL